MSEPEPGKHGAALETAEDAIDLSDMKEGIDGALAGMPRDDAAEEAEFASATRRPRLRARRSPVLAVIVMLAGLYLLSTMWADFRYWLRGDDDLRELGTVADIYREGAFVDDFDNLYVVIEGTPDVQHAAVMKTQKGAWGYLRLREAGGSLFASVPREDERPHDRFQGRFQGRMRELEALWSYEYLEQFFNTEEILHTVDVEPGELARALRAGDANLSVAGEDRIVTLGEADRLRIVVTQPDAGVQLGNKTWPKVEDAEAAVAELGYPWARLQRDGGHFHAFVVRVPESERDAARARLDAGHDIPVDNPDPKVGAMVLQRTATYVVAPDELGVAGDAQLILEYGENTTSPGYVVDGDRLVEKGLDGGRLALDLHDVLAVRVERQIRVDPAGYAIIVEDVPSEHWLDGLLFLIVVGLVTVNAASLAIAVRRLRG